MLIRFSRFQLFALLWTIAPQAPLSMGCSRQEYWSGLSCSPPGNLPDPGIEPVSPVAHAFQADSLPVSYRGAIGSPHWYIIDNSCYVNYYNPFQVKFDNTFQRFFKHTPFHIDTASHI